MSLRRYVSLMHGLGYAPMPERHPSVRPVLSQESLRSLPRGLVRYAPAVSDG